MTKRAPRLTPDEKDLALTELRVTAEVIELFHGHDLYLPARTIFLGSVSTPDGYESGVDARMAEAFLKNLHVLEFMNPDAPVDVVMDNPGGDVYHGLAIYDAIRMSPCEVTVKARGYAMSMGSIILQAADRRLMSPNAVQMIHYGTDSITHHAKTVAVRAREGERINDWMELMYLARIHEKRPSFTLGQLKEMLAFDKFLTAQESIDLGLADEIA